MTLSCAEQVVGWPDSDGTAPTVSSTNPEAGATEVPLNAAVAATFSEPMNPATITGTSFVLTQGTTEVAGSVIYVGVTALFTPAGGLEANLPYTATIRDSVTDLAGNHLAVAYTWTFTAGLGEDATAPRVTASNPVNDAVDVALNANIIATFSEAMDPGTITDSSFTLRDGATAVPGTVATVGVSATFRPTDVLVADTLYTATVTSAATDLAGNPLAADYVWTFRTGGDADTEAPRVIATNPISDATGVAVGVDVIATFSEAMDPATLSTATFTVLDGVTPVPGSVTSLGLNVTFSPTSPLVAGTAYTATITDAVTDLAGNALAVAYTWSFTTASDVGEDLTAPEVIATNPVDNATAVLAGANLIATFSEAMDSATISETSFTLFDGGTPVPGAVTTLGFNSTFNPTNALAANTTYTATITDAVTDLAGNALAVAYTWSFTTAIDGGADLIAPEVIATNPLNNATAVVPSTNIICTFSEAMDPATITGALTVMAGANPVTGTVSYLGFSATFNPTSALTADTTYSATIANTVTDLAGNALAVAYTWSFTTAADGTVDLTAPEVIATNPVRDAIGTMPDANIIATFSEAMAPATITGAFTVLDGATAVPGTVSYLGFNATFNPTSALDADTTYTATIANTVTDLAGNALAVAYSWSFTTAVNGAIDLTAPMVIATNPITDAIDVAADANLIATFNEAMAPASIMGAFTVLDGATPVPGTVTYLGFNATFNPTSALSSDTVYSATIANTVTDLAGNAMVAPYTWTFTTLSTADLTAPIVTATNPVADAMDVATDANIIATFSEAMAPATITGAFTVLDGVIPVPGTVTYVGLNASFNPTSELANDTVYTATIANTVTDLAGNAMVAPYSWTFMSGVARDTTAPTVIATNPVSNAMGTMLNASVTATFSEAMDAATIDGMTFTLFDNGTPVPGVVSFIGVTATFNPTDDFANDTTYTATILNAVTDLAGNPLAMDYVWTFTTGPVPDTRAPSVTFTVPADDASGVAIDTQIQAIFSEEMDPTTITAVNFTVQQLNGAVVGMVTYTGVTATFTPTSPLDPNTILSATVTTQCQDLAGNALERNFVWNFRTGGAPDTTRPLVISTVPADLAIEVSLDAEISAVFSESMDPMTVNATTFLLEDGVGPVEGAVTLTGANVVFNPTNDLDPDTTYTATITIGAMDRSGNALLEDYVWTFTTGALLDPGAPMVILTYPLDMAIDVPLTTTVSATFDEDMDPLTITTATFTLAGPGLVEVVGTVVYDALTLTGTFTPLNDLLPATTYTATVTVEATDLAGNGLTQDYVWIFSTAEVLLGLQPVNLRSLATFVAVAGAGLTNSNSGGPTVLNGDVGLTPTATCLGDGSPCSALNPLINGTLYANDPEGVAAQAKVDLTAALRRRHVTPGGHDGERHLGHGAAPGRLHLRLYDEHRRGRDRHARRPGRRQRGLDLPDRLVPHRQQQRAAPAHQRRQGQERLLGGLRLLHDRLQREVLRECPGGVLQLGRHRLHRGGQAPVHHRPDHAPEQHHHAARPLAGAARSVDWRWTGAR